NKSGSPATPFFLTNSAVLVEHPWERPFDFLFAGFGFLGNSQVHKGRFKKRLFCMPPCSLVPFRDPATCSLCLSGGFERCVPLSQSVCEKIRVYQICIGMLPSPCRFVRQFRYQRLHPRWCFIRRRNSGACIDTT